MNTFYGGPRGQNFILSKIFHNTQELKEDLKLGVNSPIKIGGLIMISYGGTPDSDNYIDNLQKDIQEGQNNCNASIYEKICIGSESESQNFDNIIYYDNSSFPYYAYKFLTSSLGVTKPPLNFIQNFNIDVTTEPQLNLSGESINWWQLYGVEETEDNGQLKIDDNAYYDALECYLYSMQSTDMTIHSLLNNIKENETIVGNFVLYKNQTKMETIHLTVFYIRTQNQYIENTQTAQLDLSSYFVIAKISGFYQPPEELSEIKGFAYDSQNNKILLGSAAENTDQIAAFPNNSIIIGNELLPLEDSNVIVLGQYNSSITPQGVSAQAKQKFILSDGTEAQNRHNFFGIYQEPSGEYKIVLNNEVIHETAKNFDTLNRKLEAIKNLPIINTFLDENYNKKQIPASKQDFLFCQDEVWREININQYENLFIPEPECNFHFIMPYIEDLELEKVELIYATNSAQSDYTFAAYKTESESTRENEIINGVFKPRETSDTSEYLVTFTPYTEENINIGLYPNRNYQIKAYYKTKGQCKYGLVVGIDKTATSSPLLYNLNNEATLREFNRTFTITLDNIKPTDGFATTKDGQISDIFMIGFVSQFQNYFKYFNFDTKDIYTTTTGDIEILNNQNPIEAKDLQNKTTYKFGDYIYTNKYVKDPTTHPYKLFQYVSTDPTIYYTSTKWKDNFCYKNTTWHIPDDDYELLWVDVTEEIEKINSQTDYYGAGYAYSIFHNGFFDFWYMADKIANSSNLKPFYTGETPIDNSLLPSEFYIIPNIGDYYTPDEGVTKYYVMGVNHDKYYKGTQYTSEFDSSGNFQTLTDIEINNEDNIGTAAFTFGFMDKEYSIDFKEDAWGYGLGDTDFRFKNIIEWMPVVDGKGGYGKDTHYFTNYLCTEAKNIPFEKDGVISIPTTLYQCNKHYISETATNNPHWNDSTYSGNWTAVTTNNFFNTLGVSGHFSNCGYHNLNTNASTYNFGYYKDSHEPLERNNTITKADLHLGFGFTTDNKYVKKRIIATTLPSTRTGKNSDEIIYSLHKIFLPSEYELINTWNKAAAGNVEILHDTQYPFFDSTQSFIDSMVDNSIFWTRSPSASNGWVMAKKNENNISTGTFNFSNTSRHKQDINVDSFLPESAFSYEVQNPNYTKVYFYFYADGCYTAIGPSHFYLKTTFKAIPWKMFCI